MHVLIINGSPRTQKLSNTDKIIHSLIKGMEQDDKDLTYELYSVSDRKQWKDAGEAFAGKPTGHGLSALHLRRGTGSSRGRGPPAFRAP